MLKLIGFIRLQLLLLFVLLQCVAPLAHAHVNGHNIDHGIHISYVDHADSNGHEQNTPYLAADQDNTAVVKLPPEARSFELMLAQAVDSTGNSLIPLCNFVAQRYIHHPRQFLPFISFQHPCSQAPPA